MAGLLVGMLGQMAALRVAEGVGQVQLGVALVGLNQDDVGLGVQPLILLDAQHHARMNHGAKGLAQHGGQAPVNDVRNARGMG